MKKKVLYLCFALLISIDAFSQLTGINTKSPNANSYVHFDQGTGAVTIFKGVLLSRYSTTERNSNFSGLGVAENGLLIYNTTENCYNYWKHDGTTGIWVSLCDCLPPSSPLIFHANCAAATVNPSTLSQYVAMSGGTINLPIKVITGGTINAINESINGINFTMAATPVTTSTSSLTINFAGTPTTAGVILFPIKDNAGNVICNVRIPVVLNPATFTCTASPVSNIAGNYQVDYPLTSANTFVVSYNVTVPGSYTSLALTGGGMSFTAPAGTFTSTGSQTVTFTASPINPSNTPTTFGNNTLTGTGVKGTCPIVIPVTYGNAELTCSSPVVTGNYIVETNLTAAEKVTMNFNVTKRGNAVIASEDKNGIKFGLTTQFTTLGTNSSVTIPNITATTGSNPQTAEETSLGGNGANNQTAQYTFTNNGTTIGCPVTIDVKPKLITGPIINSSLSNWNIAGFSANGAADSRIRLEMSTKFYGFFDARNGTSQFWNVPLRNVSGAGINFDINGSSYFDSNRLILTNTLADNAILGSVDPYNPFGTRVNGDNLGDNGAHAGNYAGGQEESEAGLLVQSGSKWYKYRIIYNTTSSGTNNYIILFGIYSAKPTNYVTQTAYLSKDENLQTYWP